MTSPAPRPSMRDDLTTVELDGEAVVYDESTGELHHLNPSAAVVLALCDGTMSVDEMAEAVSEAFEIPVGDVIDQVRAAIGRFEEAGLLT
ncbi:MAG TPA: HPr-rel-A system PqqD family peptide chaperone [Gaiellaceae bacterium]|nr:HPr-rel-A system PqqD family peptide chaperone [Gaiellaceae bacterium]